MFSYNPNEKHRLKKLPEVHEETSIAEMTGERLVQVSSVLRILRETLQKLKISLILPKILENPVILRDYLSHADYSECLHLLEAYVEDRQQNRRNDLPDYLNFRLIKVIDFFHEKSNSLKHLAQYHEVLSHDDKNLLQAFELLRQITEQRLKKSALFELSKEKKIHEIYHENEIFKKNIEDFKTQLRSQKINLRWKLAAKEGVIKKHEEIIALKKDTNNARIREEMLKSSLAIRQIYNASLIKQRELDEELKIAKMQYEYLLKDNLKQERSARNEKNKLLLQVQALIQKFDQSIGDKMREKMSLEEEYEKQKKIFDEFMIKYRDKEAEYDVVVRQKEEEEHRQHQERIMLFILNRAARIIQRYYRRYRKQQKRKAKKSRGSKGAKGAKVAAKGKKK